MIDPTESATIGMQRTGPVRQFLMSFVAGLTALGIVTLWGWLRAPALRRTNPSA
jgi:hypothetical protein